MRKRNLTSNSFLFGLQPLLNPLPRFGRHSLRNMLYQVVRVLVRRIAQKTDLLSITPTPFLQRSRCNHRPRRCRNGSLRSRASDCRRGGLLAIGGKHRPSLGGGPSAYRQSNSFGFPPSDHPLPRRFHDDVCTPITSASRGWSPKGNIPCKRWLTEPRFARHPTCSLCTYALPGIR